MICCIYVTINLMNLFNKIVNLSLIFINHNFFMFLILDDNNTLTVLSYDYYCSF